MERLLLVAHMGGSKGPVTCDMFGTQAASRLGTDMVWRIRKPKFLSIPFLTPNDIGCREGSYGAFCNMQYCSCKLSIVSVLKKARSFQRGANNEIEPAHPLAPAQLVSHTLVKCTSNLYKESLGLLLLHMQNASRRQTS